MPVSRLTGKSKEDLATIAVVSGLLTLAEARAMTKPNLLKFLKTAESAVGQTPPVNTAESDPQPAAAEPEPQPEAASPSQPEAEAATTDMTAEAVSAAESSPDSGAAAADAVLDDDSLSENLPAARPNTRRRTTAGRPARNQTGAVRNQTGPARTNRNAPSSGRGRTKAGVRAETPAAPGTARRPTRVKVFGVPANPLADEAEESETTLTAAEVRPAERQAAREETGTLPVAPAESQPPVVSPSAMMPTETQPNAAEPASAGQPARPEIREPVAERPAGAEGEMAPPAPEGETTGPAADKGNRRPPVESGDLVTGVLEIMPDGYGFLRRDNYLQGAKDAYVPPQYIRRFNLRPGDLVTGPCRKQRDNDRYQALLYIKEVNGQPPDKMIRRPHFDRLVPIYPNERFVLETARNELSTRIIDLVAPIGKGQRGMIVSPPKAGKTILLQKIANAISTNNPDVKLIVLLIDERPEEVTDMQRSIKGEVVFSTFDKTPENHVKVTELVLERAMRLVELKQDVVILLDSMTRLARAYNLTITPTGRTLSGGLDPGALYGPKRFFGAARNIENGGSLTIIATSLIDTGSRMDEVIFEEFKGTGNMEVYLDRKLSEKRIFPAIDINRSGTRREELLLTQKELDAVWTIRKAFGQLDTAAVTETIINLLLKTQNNQQFISSINVSFNDKNVFEAMRGTRPGQATGTNGSAPGYGPARRNADRDDD